MYAHTQTLIPKENGRSILLVRSYLSYKSNLHVNWALGGEPRALAHMLDSLVRVTRRDVKKHFVWVHRRFSKISQNNNEAKLIPRSEDCRKTLLPNGSISAISGSFHSLFKVLFIFPSRYLFAIGLPPIFSFRWNLPPA